METLDSIDENSDSSIFEQNEIILKIKELLDYLTSESTRAQDDSKSIDTVSSSDLSILQTSTANNNDTINYSKKTSDNDTAYSYVELLALYENERNYRTTCK